MKDRTLPIGTILAPIVLALTLGACGTGEDDCPDVSEADFDRDVLVTGVESVQARYENERGALRPVGDGESVQADELVLYVESSYRVVESDTASSSGGNWLDFFVAPARACSPALEDTRRSLSPLASIDIIDQSAFDAEIGPGEPLDEVVSVVGRPVLGFRSRGVLPEATFQPLGEYLASATIAPLELFVKFRTPPAAGPHAFTVFLSLENGQVFEATSPTVTVEAR